MIDINNLYGINRDMHLNVFWQYDGHSEYENNITKALINTFESLDDKSKAVFIRDLFGISLPDSKAVFRLFLQTSPSEEEVKNVPESNRLLFAFSPTGKSWGVDGIDKNNEFLIKEKIQESFEHLHTDLSEAEIKKLTENQFLETKEIMKNKGGSIPDARILIYCADSAYCIAMENKLYDLDPFQLNNHCEKSLFLRQNKIICASYNQILEELEKLNGYLINDFLVYMLHLKYWEVNNLAQLEGLERGLVDYYCQARCLKLLIDISPDNKISRHRSWMYRFFTDHDEIHEIGMKYDPVTHKFIMPLYLGSIQNKARNMYENFKNGCAIDTKYNYGNTFHFQHIQRGLSETRYAYEGLYIEKYISFWINHTELIKKSDKEERRTLLDKMLQWDIIPESEYKRVLDYSDKYDREWNVCPEFGVYIEWTYEEDLELDKENHFESEVIKAIYDVCDMFKINKPTLNVI